MVIYNVWLVLIKSFLLKKDGGLCEATEKGTVSPFQWPFSTLDYVNEFFLVWPIH